MKLVGFIVLLIQAGFLTGHFWQVKSIWHPVDDDSENNGNSHAVITRDPAVVDNLPLKKGRQLRSDFIAHFPVQGSHYARQKRNGGQMLDALDLAVQNSYSFISPETDIIQEKRTKEDETRRRDLRKRRDEFQHVHTRISARDNTNYKRTLKWPFSAQKRYQRMTSKFTGLVVGASRDNSLKESVKNQLNQIENAIWITQSQTTRPFDRAKQEYATVLGTFVSYVETNFHGAAAVVELRRSPLLFIPDVNSYTTLLVLQCLAEASVYGGAPNPSVSNMSAAVEALEDFHTRLYSTGSSIITMWPEKVSKEGKLWINVPENILQTTVKEGNTFKQYQSAAKSCKCEDAKSGAEEMAKDNLCKDYFATPLATMFQDKGTPPDFVTSFANLALGSLFLARHHEEKNGGSTVYSAESELWLAANDNMKKLLDKLKDMIIIFPASQKDSPPDVKPPEEREKDKSDKKTASETVTNSEDSEGNKNNSSVDSSGKDRDEGHVEKVSKEESEIHSNATDETHDNETIHARSLRENDANDVYNDESNSTNASETNTSNSPEIPEPTTTTTTTFSATPTNAATSSDAGTSAVLTTSAAITLTEIDTRTASKTTKASSETTAKASTATTPEVATKPKSSATTTTTAKATTTTATTTTLTTTAAPTSTVKKPHVNQILDAVSYYGLRPYLDEVVPDGKEDVILIPSLISDEPTEDGGKNDGNIWHNGQVFQYYNYVDLLTTATTLHALVLSSMAGFVDVQSDDILQKIMTSSLRLLTWYINHPKELVTMVTLSHFPSRYQLYWQVSRIAFQLNSKQAQQSGEFKFADKEISSFVKALRDKMTYSILQSITDAGLGQDGKTRVYVDDFIGAADLDDKGKRTISGDDRLFTSAMASSALILTWTRQLDDGSLKFVEGVNDAVRIAVNSLANYMTGAVLDTSSSFTNAFMSEQVKNCETLPAWYPFNVITSLDGKEVTATEPNMNLRFGIKGYIAKEEYQKRLDNPPFKHKASGEGLDVLNSPTSVFRFWSSPTFTKAACLLAIAQAANLQVDGNN